MVGLTLEAAGCVAPVGSRCVVAGPDGGRVEAEVVGFAGGKLFLMPSGDIHGLVPNARVIPASGASRLYLVIDRLQLGAGATEQHHGSTVGGIGERRFAADTVTGTRYQNDLVLEQIPRGLIIEHVHSC